MNRTFSKPKQSDYCAPSQPLYINNRRPVTTIWLILRRRVQPDTATGCVLSRLSRKIIGPFAQTDNAQFSPNFEVAGGGGLDEARPECARPRAQQLASFKPRNISQPPARPTWLRSGRPHSANAEIQLRSSGLEMPSHRHWHGMADEIVFAVGGLSGCHTISQ